MMMAVALLAAAVVLAQPKQEQADEVAASGNRSEVKAKGFHPPAFPGGKDQLQTYFKQNLKYPPQALKNNVQGDVFVKFTVRKDGSIAQPKVLRSLDPACDKEALRLLTSMPKWQPGTQDDKPVDMVYTIPIHFVPDQP
jgi:TonB family protein